MKILQNVNLRALQYTSGYRHSLDDSIIGDAVGTIQMKSFTCDLVAWIEKNLDKKILLDEVADKSGYSKWYLQRLFRQETGMKLASYIRERRLTESAIFLKMTAAPVNGAAERFGFTNQQAFTRAFTKYFCLPPARYRQSEDWRFHDLQPSLLSVPCALPEPTWFDAPVLSDVTYSYLCDSANLSCVSFHTAHREQGLKKAAQHLDGEPPSCFAIRFEPAGAYGNIRFILTFGGRRNANAGNAFSRGKFMRFAFEGIATELTELQVYAYRHILPNWAEARRNGQDLFILEPDNNENILSPRFRGNYYIPVNLS